MATVKLQDPTSYVIQKVPVVRHRDYCASISLQVLFQPMNRLGIKVVSRLVQQQNVRFLQQKPAQGHPTKLTTRQHRDRGVFRGASKRVHRQFQLGIQVPGIHRVETVLHLPLPFHQLVHFLVGHFLGKFGVDFIKLRQQVNDRLDTLLNDINDGFARVQLWFLFQIPNGKTRGNDRLPQEFFIHPCHYFQQSRFS